MAKIQLSKDYNNFKKMNGNRPIDEGHVKKLMQSIKEKDFTASNPIKVDADFNIIDGQHRFTACKNLGLPIYYIQDDFDPKDFIRLNRHMKNVKISEYINFLAKNGDPEFQCLMRISEITEMPPNYILTFYKGRSSVNILEDECLKIRQDAQEIVDTVTVMKEVLDVIAQTPLEEPHYIKTLKFCRTLYRFIQETDDFDKDRFIKNVRMKYNWLINYGSKALYFECLKRIYNFQYKKNLA